MRDEDQLIAWLRGRLREAGSPDLLGDDAALLPPSGPLAVTTDTQIEDVHFPNWLPPEVLATRLLEVNLSDLAASGAEPYLAFLALTAPRTFDHQRFLDAFVHACQERSVHLAGGDLSSSDRVSAVLTLLGRQRANGRWLRRRDAKPDQALWLGGRLGESTLGLHLLQAGARTSGDEILLDPIAKLPLALHDAARRAIRRHLYPVAQLDLSAWLTQQEHVAALDISDGFTRDLHRLCRESKVGAVIHQAALPTGQDHEALASFLEVDPEQAVLTGGEDYVLLFTLQPDQQPPARFQCHRVGQITDGRQVLLEGLDGGLSPLDSQGWDHLAG